MKEMAITCNVCIVLNAVLRAAASTIENIIFSCLGFLGLKFEYRMRRICHREATWTQSIRQSVFGWSVVVEIDWAVWWTRCWLAAALADDGTAATTTSWLKIPPVPLSTTVDIRVSTIQWRSPSRNPRNSRYDNNTHMSKYYRLYYSI